MVMAFQEKSFKERQAELHLKSLEEFPGGIAERRTVTPRLEQGLAEVSARKEAEQKRQAALTKTPEEQAAIEKEAAGPSQVFSAGGGDQRPPAAFTTPAPSTVYADLYAQEVANREPKLIKFEDLSPEEQERSGAVVPITADDILLAFNFGIVGSTKQIASAAAGKALAKTGNIFTVEALTGATGKLAVNTATAKLTTSWITKLTAAVKSPAFIVPTILGAIGSYPFAGFIKEEALQTISFAIEQGIRNKDVNGTSTAIEVQREILKPDIWSSIIAGVPYANIVIKLKDFFKASVTKLKVDEKRFEDMKKEIAKEEATGLTKDQRETAETTERFEKITADKQDRDEQERLETEAYYARINENNRIAKEEERAEDEAYWAKIIAETQARQEKKRREDDKYWADVRKQREENRKSTLKFGLLK